MTKTSLVLITVTCFVGWFVIEFVRDSGRVQYVDHRETSAVSPNRTHHGTRRLFVIDPALNVAFISSDDRITGQQGNIYQLSLDAPDHRPEQLLAHVDFEFHPHGIDVYRWPNDQISLYAINHRKESDFIEVFTYQDGHAIHQQSINLHMKKCQ